MNFFTGTVCWGDLLTPTDEVNRSNKHRNKVSR